MCAVIDPDRLRAVAELSNRVFDACGLVRGDGLHVEDDLSFTREGGFWILRDQHSIRHFYGVRPHGEVPEDADEAAALAFLETRLRERSGGAP
jgi:hypothetical protein